MTVNLPPVRRVLFVGMNNPRPGQPLWPKPHNTAGHRLYRLVHLATGWSMDDYIDRTERVNFVDGTPWTYDAAKARLPAMRALADGRKCIAIGVPAATVLEAPYGADNWMQWDGQLAAMPHTSPFNRFWNNQGNWDSAIGFLREALS